MQATRKIVVRKRLRQQRARPGTPIGGERVRAKGAAQPFRPASPPQAASDAPDSRTRQAAKVTARRGAGRRRWMLAARTPRVRSPAALAPPTFGEAPFVIRVMLTGCAPLSCVYKCTKIGPLTRA